MDKKWPWSERHTWQSWRDRYSKNQDWFNHRIWLYQEKKNLPQEHHVVVLRSPKPSRLVASRDCISETQQLFTRRAPFTDEDDEHLVGYLATYSPGIAGRLGNNLYKNLIENVSGADM